MSITPKTHPIKALYSLDSSRSYGRLLENLKTRASRDLFLPESDFNLLYIKFSKNHPDFGGLETNQRHETQTRILFHIPFYIWTQYKNCSGHLLGTSSRCHKFWGQNLQFYNFLNFTVFELYISGSINFFLTAIWLSHSQLWAILEGTALLTQC